MSTQQYFVPCVTAHCIYTAERKKTITQLGREQPPRQIAKEKKWFRNEIKYAVQVQATTYVLADLEKTEPLLAFRIAQRVCMCAAALHQNTTNTYNRQVHIGMYTTRCWNTYKKHP